MCLILQFHQSCVRTLAVYQKLRLTYSHLDWAHVKCRSTPVRLYHTPGHLVHHSRCFQKTVLDSEVVVSFILCLCHLPCCLASTRSCMLLPPPWMQEPLAVTTLEDVLLHTPPGAPSAATCCSSKNRLAGTVKERTITEGRGVGGEGGREGSSPTQAVGSECHWLCALSLRLHLVPNTAYHATAKLTRLASYRHTH